MIILIKNKLNELLNFRMFSTSPNQSPTLQQVKPNEHGGVYNAYSASTVSHSRESLDAPTQTNLKDFNKGKLFSNSFENVIYF